MDPQFIFIGRLEQEKWFDILCNTLEKLAPKVKAHFFICWDWSFRTRILELSSKINNIHFFGRCTHDEIIQKISSSHYMIMPSQFLETFWLTALESLCLWVPVIWYQKWGCQNFIIDNLAINKQNGGTETEKISHLLHKTINNFDPFVRKKLSNNSIQLTKQYTPDIRYTKVQQLFPKWNSNPKILLISDYETELWGIEKHIQLAKEILQQKWHECISRWRKIKKDNFLLPKKYMWMLLSVYNLRAQQSIQKLIKSFQPDIIWRHSTLRFIGHKWLDVSTNAKQIITYHDLGYFVSHPSSVNNESQIPQTNSFEQFSIIKNPSFIQKIQVYIKHYLATKLRKKITNNIDYHIVPSNFLQYHIEKLYNINEDNIKVIPHFLSPQFLGIQQWLLEENNNYIKK